MATSLPLKNQRIVVTRSLEQADSFCEKLEALGAIPIRFPVIQFAPLPAPELDNALSQLDVYDWLIFTSGNAVRFTVASSKWQVASETIRNTQYAICVASVGSATQNLLAAHNIPVDFVPQQFTGEQLVLGLGDVSGKRILLPRAKIGRPEIVALLRERGAIVDDIALYETVTAVPTPKSVAELAKGADIITFTSPSSVRNYLKIVNIKPQGFLKPLGFNVAVIGPSTGEEAEKFGLTVDIMPDKYTIDGLIDAIVTYCVSHIA